MNQHALPLIAFLSLSLQACVANVGAKGVQVPSDSQHQCASQCQSIGMRLSAVAIMANTVGCVCQTAGAAAGAQSSAGISAGMATIAMQQASQQQQQQQQRARR